MTTKARLDFSAYERRGAEHGCQEVVARTAEERNELDQYIGAQRRVKRMLGKVMTQMRRNGVLEARPFRRSVRLGVTIADEYALLIVSGRMEGLCGACSTNWRVVLISFAALKEAQQEAIRHG